MCKKQICFSHLIKLVTWRGHLFKEMAPVADEAVRSCCLQAEERNRKSPSVRSARLHLLLVFCLSLIVWWQMRVKKCFSGSQPLDFGCQTVLKHISMDSYKKALHYHEKVKIKRVIGRICRQLLIFWRNSEPPQTCLKRLVNLYTDWFVSFTSAPCHYLMWDQWQLPPDWSETSLFSSDPLTGW